MNCKYCEKECKNLNSLRQHEIRCHKNPERISVSNTWKESMKNFDRKTLNPSSEQTCKFCGRKKIITKGGNTRHEALCEKNPNKVDNSWVGRKHSEESKKRISDGAKKAHDEGRGHTWKNRYLNPSYAEKWLYGVLDSNNIVYVKEKSFFGFFLDVALDGNKCIEIDGEQHYDEKRFPEQIEKDKRKEKLLFENGWKLLRLRWSHVKKDPKKYVEIIAKFLYE